MANDDDLQTIRDILIAARTAILTSRAASGALHSRPLALLDEGVDGTKNFEGTLWFFTADPSDKTDEIRRHPEVNVSVSHSSGYLSLSGSASIDRNQARIDLLWNPFAEAWFEKGKDDPSVALVRVDVESVELWDTDRPAPVKAFELVKGLLTKQAPNMGENKTVEL